MGLRNINIKDKAFKILDDMIHQPRLKLCIIGYGTIGKIITGLLEGHELLVVDTKSTPKNYTDRVINGSESISYISLVDSHDPINYQNYDAVIICPWDESHIAPMINQLKSIHYQGVINVLIPSHELNNTPMDYIIPFQCKLLQLTHDQEYDPTHAIPVMDHKEDLVKKIINSVELKYNDGENNDY